MAGKESERAMVGKIRRPPITLHIRSAEKSVAILKHIFDQLELNYHYLRMHLQTEQEYPIQVMMLLKQKEE
ncbi:MAG TPA: hypothetical protein VND99_01470 [Candidatus Acidoferrales bacterium]|nr:hypothetical protein [Candidatus Acidoferrales bacterium]